MVSCEAKSVGKPINHKKGIIEVFSILHISDLHRSPSDLISNEELISALISDREHYVQEDYPIQTPDAIIVSGDIIQGVPLNTENYESKLIEQYKSAESFLDELVKRFLSGDRSRIVIVPGNHDVDWNSAFKSMSIVSVSEYPKDLAKALFSDESMYRWNWKTRELYQISNSDNYEKRLSAFWDFFDRFYSGVPGVNVNRCNKFNVFKLCDDKICVVAFNSCEGNDCFSFHGKIQKSFVAKSHLNIKDQNCIFDLQIAVWHHNVEGPPYRTDYMDIEIIKSMIGKGFRLGLYGHQHKPQAEPHNIYLPDLERMALVSAGSLCAGASELPTGQYRQYNVIEISDNFQNARIHVREMRISNLFSKAALSSAGGKSFVELDWEPPKDITGRKIDTKAERIRVATEKAEQLFHDSDLVGCSQLLLMYKNDLSKYGRMLLIDSLYSIKNWKSVIELANPPLSVDEFFKLIESLIKIKEYNKAKEAITQFEDTVGLDIPTKQLLQGKILAEERMNQ